MNQFAGLDAKKAIHVVDMVWDNKDKIITIINDLPEMLQKAGDGIEAAGRSAFSTSVMLVGGGDKPWAGDISELAEKALESACKELGDVGDLLERLGDEIDDVNIPSFKPDYSEVMGIKVMAGVDLGENKMIDNAADRPKGGARRLGTVGATWIRWLGIFVVWGGTLTDAGEGLDSVGSKLMGSGEWL